VKFDIIIVTGPKCPWCDAAKQLLNTKNIEYTELEATSDKGSGLLNRERVRSVPAVFFNDDYLGGYEALRNYVQSL
jgi:glutaredoxin